MEPSMAGAFPRKRIALLCAAASILLPSVPATRSIAAEIAVSSRTYLAYSERDVPGGEKQTFAPLYEYLSADARGVGGRPVSFHFYGWGRQDLADDSGSDKRTGDLGSAYMSYLHPKGNGEVRLGRFFLVEGAAAEIMDGAFVKVRTGPGIGVSLYGGIPVERSITSTKTGDSIYGGRLFFASAGFLEIGASYLFEKGPFQGEDREVVGGDIWLRPGIPVELTGRAAYNVSTEALASQKYVLRIFPIARVDFSVGYDFYKYNDLFQNALNPAFLTPAVDGRDEVRIVFADLDLEVAKGLTLEAGVKNIKHDLANPGDADRGEVGLRYAYNDRKDAAGLSAAAVKADRDENEYEEYRAFATFSPGGWRFAVDALTHRYKNAIDGIKEAWHAVGSAGWQALSYLKVSGDLTYNRSPRFKEDYAGLLRVSLDFGTVTGGTK